MKLFLAVASLMLSILLGIMCFLMMKDGEHLILAAFNGIMCGSNLASFFYMLVGWFYD